MAVDYDYVKKFVDSMNLDLFNKYRKAIEERLKQEQDQKANQ